MLGIKTKKDKRIEELEKLVTISRIEVPQIIRTQRNVQTLAVKRALDERMPVEYAKEAITYDIARKLGEYIRYDIEDDGGDRVLKGYIGVVLPDRWE